MCSTHPKTYISSNCSPS
uniref:Uncharacterized protein n=1 Tax=Arundo donax TaxID=35708 RepID=A0A0A9ABW7_ARUDO